MQSFDFDDVNLSVEYKSYISELTARMPLGTERGTHWRKFPVSEYWLARISRLSHNEFLKELKKAYDVLRLLPQGTILVETCNVMGVSYIEGAAEVCAGMKIGAALTIKPEPENPHDPGALKVFRLGKPIGYIPKERNWEIHRNIKDAHYQKGKLFARVVEHVSVYGKPSVYITVLGKVLSDKETVWEGVEKESDDDEKMKKALWEELKNFLRLRRALTACGPCGRLITVLRSKKVKILPLSGSRLAKRSYDGNQVKLGEVFSQNDLFRSVELPADATGFAVFTGCCLTYICLCASHQEAVKWLWKTPSFSHGHGHGDLTEKIAWSIVRQYLHGLDMFGIDRSYCYFGHQNGLDGLGECFLDDDGGLFLAYIRCYSRQGFEPRSVPRYLMSSFDALCRK